VEKQCSIKAMLSVILGDLADNNPEKKQALVDDCNKCREKKLLRVAPSFVSWEDPK
jgi:hypothetical protein